MGNCLKCHKNSTLEEEMSGAFDEVEKIERMASPTLSKLSRPSMDATTSCKKKVVRFGLGDDAGGDNVSGVKTRDVVRLRIVVSTQELNQILSRDKDRMSLDQLLDVVRTSGRRIAEVENCSGNGNLRCWKPSLESISEDH